MDPLRFPASLDVTDDGVVVTFRDVPEAITGASDWSEAVSLAEDALEEALLAKLAFGEPVSPPSAAEPGEVLIPVPSELAAKLGF